MPKRRNVFDAVVGRLRTQKFFDSTYTGSTGAETPAVSPDEHLLGIANIAEVPFVEHQDLPDSNIIHAYLWYAATYLQRYYEPSVWHMYDETALIAIAILIEETIKDGLGNDGHLVWASE